MAEHRRVLLVLGPSTGGVGTHVHLLAGALVARGHQVTVCGPDSTRAAFDWPSTGAGFESVPVAVKSASAVLRARAALRRIAPAYDVVHAHGSRAGAAAAAARLHPLVVSWHNAPVGRPARRAVHAVLERLAARSADVTLTASPDLAQRARRAGGGTVRFAPVVAPPLPPATHSREEVRAELGVGERPVVLAVARLARQKRLDLLVDATAGWLENPAGPLLLVAGSGRFGTELQQQATRLGSPLRLLGYRSDVADLLGAADVLALSSDWEARPFVVQEALRAGVPVVATDVGGVRELTGDAAVLVPAGDPAGLRDALQQVLADGRVADRLRQAGPQRAATWPTVADMVDGIETAYDDALMGGAAG